MLNERNAMLKKIQEGCFMLSDIHLYQDTHPADRSLDNKVKELMCAVHELVSTYEAKYGALTYLAGTPEQWLASPWPWEICKEG